MFLLLLLFCRMYLCIGCFFTFWSDFTIPYYTGSFVRLFFICSIMFDVYELGVFFVCFLGTFTFSGGAIGISTFLIQFSRFVLGIVWLLFLFFWIGTLSRMFQWF